MMNGLSSCSPSPAAHTGGALGMSLFNRLMRHAAGHANAPFFAQMIASQRVGMGSLPFNLGLCTDDFIALCRHCFPNSILNIEEIPACDVSRYDERADILTLLRSHLAGNDPAEGWMADIVSTACLGNDHLWQDLGLHDRTQLSQLMQTNFPSLAAKNMFDMKWKKFLYKQLCEQEGLRVCRAPSCEYCTDYLNCFGEEV